jgi:ATP phosphoribosyltransferase regulatory subunit
MSASADAMRGAIAALDPVWVAPPLLQPAGLYLELLGEDVRARAFLTADETGRELCLRPEMTIPVCRALFCEGRMPPPLAAYDGLVFRRQSAGSERESEFAQLGCERFALDALTVSDEAALIAAAVRAVRVAGVEPVLQLGHAGVFAAFVESVGLDPAWAERLRRASGRPGKVAGLIAAAAAPADEPPSVAGAVDAMAPEQAEAALEALLASAGVTPVGARPVSAIAARLQEKARFARAPKPTPEQAHLLGEVLSLSAPVEAAIAALAQTAASPLVRDRARVEAAVEEAAALWRALIAQEPPPADARFSPGLGRTVATYDGFVFELEAPALGARSGLGGGGRYDRLARSVAASLGAEALTGVQAAGFALRPLRVGQAAGRPA